MDRWKTSTKRYTPIWKIHPRGWREKRILEMISIPCQECGHGSNMHLFDPDTPDFGLCMSTQPENCNCRCEWFNEQIPDER